MVIQIEGFSIPRLRERPEYEDLGSHGPNARAVLSCNIHYPHGVWPLEGFALEGSIVKRVNVLKIYTSLESNEIRYECYLCMCVMDWQTTKQGWTR